VSSPERRPSARELRAQAQQPAAPDDAPLVQLQRSHNRYGQRRARTAFLGTAALTAVFAVLVIVVTAVRPWHATTPLVWVACVVWVTLGCFLVPRHGVPAQVALALAWADPDRTGLGPTARFAAKWAMLNLVVFVGGLIVIYVLVRVTS